MESFTEIMGGIGLALDGVGVLIVALGTAVALVRSLFPRTDPFAARYTRLRQEMGRAILLGLEVLIAGDIIRSVVVNPTLLNIAVLGLLVLVRTFLSMTLQLEIEGHWPWQRGAPE
ncbi:MAG TPA: DUF1622 domain-containing protein [Gemmatimonadaceae bacterium]|nr:DUF1622 domain-containing protein [Gemmatimonadaceae bacterium]